MEPSPEQIKEALEKSGYLFEQKAASLLEEMGFATVSNKAYIDKEKNKLCEIDVFACKVLHSMEDPALKIICYLNAECKNSTNSFVFILRNKGVLDFFYKPDGIFLAQPMYVQNHSINIDAFDYMDLSKHHYATREKQKSVQICKIIGNNKKLDVQHEGVLRAILSPLIKSKAIWIKESQQADGQEKTCRIFYNIAIINADLYTIDAEKTDALPEPAKFVPFIQDVNLGELKGKFLLTFVKYDYLREFIEKEVLAFCKTVFDFYNANPKMITETFVK
jgi:hypothetical protein